MEEADLIVLDSPNYCMEMSGAMKNFIDHFAYRYVTHRPHGKMFKKVGLTVCSFVGAPAGHTTKSLAKQLKWICVSKIYRFLMITNAMGVKDLSEKKLKIMDLKVKNIAKKIEKRVNKTHSSLLARMMFFVFKGMQKGESTWNPIDQDWWVSQGWTTGVKPWEN